MSGFDEVSFPCSVTSATTGGPRRKTEIATLGSGAEERNAVWADSRREFNAGKLIKNADDLHAVLVFFEARLGQARGFRFRDPVDNRSCAPSQTPSPLDQVIGAGDGGTDAFQLVKLYVSGSQTWSRAIKKPVTGSVRVAVAGVEKTLATDFTVDSATGIVTFLPGHVPVTGAITAGFQFEVPVRFNTDFLNANLAALSAGEIPDVPLIEIKI